MTDILRIERREHKELRDTARSLGIRYCQEARKVSDVFDAPELHALAKGHIPYVVAMIARAFIAGYDVQHKLECSNAS